MSTYTDAASRIGQRKLAGDDRALFLQRAGAMVITAYEEAMFFNGHNFSKSIAGAKADVFPIIGRKRDASEHTPGELIVGGKIAHSDVTINVDNTLVDAVFIPDIDVMLSHYSVAEPYAKQLGQSLGSANDKRIGIMHVLASRDTVSAAPGQPAPGYFWDANLKTSGAALEAASFAARRYLLENDMSGELPRYFLPFAQVLLMAKYTGIEGGAVTTGSGDRAAGTIGMVAGLQPEGSNHIPNSNITTGLAKYQGNFSSTVGFISSKHAVGTLEASGIRIVVKKQEERLGTLMIASMLNGHGVLRPECSIELRTDAIAGRDPIPAP